MKRWTNVPSGCGPNHFRGICPHRFQSSGEPLTVASTAPRTMPPNGGIEDGGQVRDRCWRACRRSRRHALGSAHPPRRVASPRGSFGVAIRVAIILRTFSGSRHDGVTRARAGAWTPPGSVRTWTALGVVPHLETLFSEMTKAPAQPRQRRLARVRALAGTRRVGGETQTVMMAIPGPSVEPVRSPRQGSGRGHRPGAAPADLPLAPRCRRMRHWLRRTSR